MLAALYGVNQLKVFGQCLRAGRPQQPGPAPPSAFSERA